MSPVEALEVARTAGIQISVDGDDLVLESAAEPPVAVVDLLTEHKAGILAILRSGQAAGSAEERVAIAEFEFRADHIGAAPLLASTDPTCAASTALTGSASTDMIGSASGGATSWTDSTALRQDWQAYYEEKAGVAQYDHEMSRQQAEKHAFACCLVKWLEQNQVSSDADDGCAVCGGGDWANDILLAVGLGGAGQAWEQVWVHWGCAPTWRAGRIAAAIVALAAMGITDSKDSST